MFINCYKLTFHIYHARPVPGYYASMLQFTRILLMKV